VIKRTSSFPSIFSGQPGQLVGRDWAANYLRTPQDYEEYCIQAGEGAVPPEQFCLDPDVAMQRLMGLAGDVFYPDQLCLSPGTVHKANSFLVEHTATMMPQSSGGAGWCKRKILVACIGDTPLVYDVLLEEMVLFFCMLCSCSLHWFEDLVLACKKYYGWEVDLHSSPCGLLGVKLVVCPAAKLCASL
jgi:hypothetical protein